GVREESRNRRRACDAAAVRQVENEVASALHNPVAVLRNGGTIPLEERCVVDREENVAIRICRGCDELTERDGDERVFRPPLSRSPLGMYWLHAAGRGPARAAQCELDMAWGVARCASRDPGCKSARECGGGSRHDVPRVSVAPHIPS